MPETTLDKIHQATLKLLYPLSLEETCSIIGKETMRLAKGDFSTILLFQEGEFTRVYASHPIFYQSKPRKTGNNYKVFKTREPLIINLSQLKGIPVTSINKTLGVKSAISVPLSYRNQSWGVLSVMSKKENHFTQRELGTLEVFAALAALALRKTQLYEQTQKALESRDLFISMAAHELRTPLTTISGYTQLLHSKLSGANTSESRWVEELSWESFRLTQLVNELLEVERIKTGELNYTWKECSIKEIINRVIMDFRFTHPDYRIIVQDQLKDGHDVVIGDFNKLLQAIINLLDNAAKFSPSSRPLELIMKNKKTEVVLVVKDQGKGINKKDLKEVFEKFYRASGHDREGMGIGLFLVKNIIKQHKGDIVVRSKEGRGTQVEVRLPRIKHG